jgi:inner membrane protein involved in colicin E2 resistance
VSGSLVTEKRWRGFFAVPVYVGQLGLTGKSRVPTADDFPEGSAVRWDQASLSLAIGDPKALRDVVPLDWGVRSIRMQPGVDWYTFGPASPSQAEPESGTS